MVRTLNIGPGIDTWGTDKLDKHPQSKEAKKFDFNKSPVRLPYKNETFDEVRVYRIMEFMLYPQEVLQECHRVLKKNGRISIITPNIQSLRFWIRPLGRRYIKGIRNWGFEHFHSFYNIYTLRDAVELAGFRVQECGYSTNIAPFNDTLHLKAKKK